MRLALLIILLLHVLASCNGGSTQNADDKAELKQMEKVKMHYYNPAFKWDSTSSLRIDGYYQIREIFGRYTTDGKSYQPNDPKYGYLQFFKDGFCRVGYWNGIFQSPSEIKEEILANKAFGFWGIYKLLGDTLLVEYLYNPASPGVKPFEERWTLTALMLTNEIVVKQNSNIIYSYPGAENSSCIGKFINLQTTYNEPDNYLKRNISKYQ